MGEKRVIPWICVFILGFIFIGPHTGCKKTDEVEKNFNNQGAFQPLTGIWRFEADFFKASKLNIHRIWIFKFFTDGRCHYFDEPQGTYHFDGFNLDFISQYIDPLTRRGGQFNFQGRKNSDDTFIGEIILDENVVGTFKAEELEQLVLYDILGTWDFKVELIESYWRELPEIWRFTFNDIGELWLFDKRKQSYQFDGINVRFPCHYYHDEATGTANHYLFRGEMISQNEIVGDMYNDVGDANIIGSFTAARYEQ